MVTVPPMGTTIIVAKAGITARNGCQQEQPDLGLGRAHLLLEEELEPVGDGLQHPERPGPVGANPVLHVGEDLALAPDEEDDDDHHQDEDGDGLAQSDENVGAVHQMAEKALLVLVIASVEHRERLVGRPSSVARGARQTADGGRRTKDGKTTDPPTTRLPRVISS